MKFSAIDSIVQNHQRLLELYETTAPLRQLMRLAESPPHQLVTMQSFAEKMSRSSQYISVASLSERVSQSTNATATAKLKELVDLPYKQFVSRALAPELAYALRNYPCILRSTPSTLAEALTTANENIGAVAALVNGHPDLLARLQHHAFPWLKGTAAQNLWLSTYDLSSHVRATLNHLNYGQESLYFSEALRFRITRAFSRLGLAYSNIWEELRNDQVRVLELNPIVIQAPPIELYQSTVLGRTIGQKPRNYQNLNFDDAEVALEEVASGFESQLAQVDPRLVNLYRGAKSALAVTGYDRTRHFATSLRELITHTLHILCPDNEFSRWNTDSKLVDRDRPTRKGRLLYICRNIRMGSFETFVDMDVKATLEFITLFQKGTHDIENSFTMEQLQAMLRRTEALLSYLVHLGKKDS
jgi:hypothetical protein